MFLNENLFFIQALEKKLLSQILYTKYYIRHSFVDPYSNKKIELVDNNSTFYNVNLKLKYFQKNYLKKKINNFGFSICLNTFIYSNRYPQFQFQFYSLSSKISLPNYIDVLFTKIRALRSTKKVLLLVNLKRGGLRCYFNGVCGFFPRRHVYYFYQNIFDKTPKSHSLKTLDRSLRLLLALSYKSKSIRFTKSIFSTLVFDEDYLWNRSHPRLQYFLFKLVQLLRRKLTIKTVWALIFIYYKRVIFPYIKTRSQNSSLYNLDLLLCCNKYILPKKLNSFIYYNLTFFTQKRYFNAKVKRKTRKWRRRLFKSRIKIVFLAYIRKKTLS